MDTRANIPDFATPIIGSDGRVNRIWWLFLLKLFDRTGGAEGVDAAVVEVITKDNAAISGAEAANNGAAELGRLFLEALAVAQAQIQQQAKTEDAFPVAVLRRILQEAPAVPVLRRYELAHETISRHGLQHDPDLHALATSLAAGFMSGTDKAKLDALPTIQPVALIADATITNSTADGNILSVTAPANSLLAGSTIGGRLVGLVSSAAITGTLSVWIKLGASKVFIQTFTMPLLGQANTGIAFYPTLTLRSAGAAGTLQISALMTSDGNALNAGPVVTTALATINTTTTNTLTLGWNWSVANAANTAIAKNAILLQEKL